MDGWMNTATDPYDLVGLPRIPMDRVIEHSRENDSKLCKIDTCPTCTQRYNDWKDEMQSERDRSYGE